MQPRDPKPVEHLSFVSGVKSLLLGALHLLRNPATWPWSMVPLILLVALWGACTAALAIWLEPVIGGWITQRTNLGRLGESLLTWTLRVTVALPALWFAVLATPTLASPALERLVEAQERALQIPPRRPQGVLREILCGIRAQAMAVGTISPLLLILWLVELAVPPTVIVVLPLKLGLVGLGAAWTLIDYPLTLRGIGVRARLRLLRYHPLAALGFGLAVAAVFWVPCGGVIMLPAAVLGATHLVWAAQRADPALWPELSGDRSASACESSGPPA